MKDYRSIFSLILICLTSMNTAAQAQGSGETGGYKLVWEDNFDAAALDRDIWHVEVNGNGGGNQELQYYRAENVSVGAEPLSGKKCLILTARNEVFNGKPATSGRVNTKCNVNILHGKIEASIRLPRTANGLWPAFWMLGSDGEWPMCGEIDIMEMGAREGISNGTQEKYFSGACHWGEVDNGGHPNYAIATTNGSSLQDDFHLWTLVWDTDYIKMYLDLDKNPNAEPYYIMDISLAWAMNHPSRYLHQPSYILFNLAVGGNFPQIWDIKGVTALNNSNNYEAKMYVDFIKVYQKGTSDEMLAITPKNHPCPNTSAEPAEPASTYTLRPNPAYTEITILGPSQPEVITIYDYAGKKVKTFAGTNTCDISDLSIGNYLLQLETGKQKHTLRLLKK